MSPEMSLESVDLFSSFPFKVSLSQNLSFFFCSNFSFMCWFGSAIPGSLVPVAFWWMALAKFKSRQSVAS